MKNKNQKNSSGSKSSSSKKTNVTKEQVKSMLQSALSKEKQIKWVCTEFESTVSDSYTDFLVPVPWPAQGTAAYDTDETGSTQGQRIGNKIEFQFWNWNTTWALDTEVSTTYAREIMFQWLQPIEDSADRPVIGDILQLGSPTVPMLTPLNYENRSKYHIIHDNVIILTNSGNNQRIVQKKTVRDIPVKTLRFTGDSQSGFGATMIKGNLFVLVISDQDAILGHPPAFAYSSAIYYTD